ncbi:MAG: hypothetical protein JWO56_3531 [Acidobacteria bacterium]|nr:hypothetical protein [Acidobacteriota bacterium]
MKRPLLTIALLLAAVFPAGPLRAGTITLRHYIDALEALRHEASNVRAAEARLLVGSEVESPNGKFTADAALLHAVAAGEPGAPARLDATLAALRALVPASASKVDVKVIERLRKDEAASELKRGGEVNDAPIATNEDALERWMRGIRKVFDWLGKWFEKIYDWIMSWWPRAGDREEQPGFGGVPFVVIGLVILIVGLLTLLALGVMRRSRRADRAPLVLSDPQASRRDEDPLSRGANEWERYAAQLAAAGRIREAIRAWYHAVLVTLYAAGTLHFRKGRTNWEYIAMLAPALPWRGSFVQLTRQFEEEWYGHDESTLEMLDECSNRAKEILADVRRGVAA